MSPISCVKGVELINDREPQARAIPAILLVKYDDIVIIMMWRGLI
jgi:hypothetical protein